MAVSETSPAQGPAQPAIILVRPQLGENIGAAARAMLNCGLCDLRLVAPRDGWPNPMAFATASGADVVLERVQVARTLEEAVADLHHVYATTARLRDMRKHVLTPEQLAVDLHHTAALGERSGILFGPERTGLFNDEVVLAKAVVNAPLNPAFCSLNLAQGVLLIAHAWYRALDDATPPRQLASAGSRNATHEELAGFFHHLETALEASGFFRVAEMKPATIRHLRNLFQRAELSEHEVRILHGAVKALAGERHRGKAVRIGGTDAD